MNASCRFSFDDLYRAAFAAPMDENKKNWLYALTQKQRNEVVGEWATRAGWYTEDRVGEDQQIYKAFWRGGDDGRSLRM